MQTASSRGRWKFCGDQLHGLYGAVEICSGIKGKTVDKDSAIYQVLFQSWSRLAGTEHKCITLVILVKCCLSWVIYYSVQQGRERECAFLISTVLKVLMDVAFWVHVLLHLHVGQFELSNVFVALLA
ncbi:hypothetical protein VNO78_31170 [Psophocarpus tetragonolobus]|uniref:Uncharacterized protein n=1 Tax=Psophocarpus tetragonolobus TaxID=3891 RepID=A0AAN9RZI6_PSOTE